MQPLAACACLLAALLALAGCSRVEEGVATAVLEPPIRVVATTGLVGDATEHVGGDRVEVSSLMGPGIDPHVYKASEGDVELLVGADLVLFNGLHLEAKLADVLERLEGRAVAVTDGIPRARLLRPPGFSGAFDPHVWFDVTLWADVVRTIEQTLGRRDPAGAPVYRRNAARYLAELAELDRWVREQAERVPAERRVIVTAHDAFNYFGRAYGFEVRGLQGISTASEAGAGDVGDLAELIAERRIPTVFVESSVSPRAIEAVQEAVRARGFEVQRGESLFSDALGDGDTPEGTYVGMVQHNVRAVVEGLEGAA